MSKLAKLAVIGIAITTVTVLVWLFVQDSRVSVYVDFQPGIANSVIQTTQMQFASATDHKLNLECNADNIHCYGQYTAKNLWSVVHYQNRLFVIAENEHLDFYSFVDGSIIARWLD